MQKNRKKWKEKSQKRPCFRWGHLGVRCNLGVFLRCHLKVSVMYAFIFPPTNVNSLHTCQLTRNTQSFSGSLRIFKPVIVECFCISCTDHYKEHVVLFSFSSFRDNLCVIPLKCMFGLASFVHGLVFHCVCVCVCVWVYSGLCNDHC